MATGFLDVIFRTRDFMVTFTCFNGHTDTICIGTQKRHFLLLPKAGTFLCLNGFSITS